MTKRNKIVLLPIFFIIVAASCLILLIGTTSNSNEDTTPSETSTDIFSFRYNLLSPPIPDTLQFAGENVPINRYDVREALDRELLVNIYWQSNILLFCKRAYRFFPMIEPILKNEGIPEDFKYLALVESGLTNVVSPAKATGFWQFMKETAINLGLEINEEVDERYHLEKSTFAACRYLKRSYKQHGSWILAAAGYNMGDGGLKQNIAKQKTSSYWDLLLNEETSRYVYRILAAKIILSDPQNYGISLKLTDLYQPLQVKQIEVDTSINSLVDFAISQGITYKQLKNFNPWLRSDKLTNKSGKKYIFSIPKKEYMMYNEQIKQINPYEIFQKV
jgi:hypothetical protein